jgi:hypothetical protein
MHTHLRSADGRVSIESGIPAAEQESSFMNATLQDTVGGELSFSVATYIGMPVYYETSEGLLEEYLFDLLREIAAKYPLRFEVQIGPTDEETP